MHQLGPGRAKDLLSLSEEGRGELGVRKLFGESDPVVVTDPEDPLPHDEVLHPVRSPIGGNPDRPRDQLRRGPCGLVDSDRQQEQRADRIAQGVLSSSFPCCLRVGLCPMAVLGWPVCRTCCIRLNGSAAQPASTFSYNGQH